MADQNRQPSDAQDESQTLLDVIDDAVVDVAGEVFLLFSQFMPAARTWSDARRSEFINESEGRLRAILAIASHGPHVADALQEDLEMLGARASAGNGSLPHLLIVLRISRDLLLQTAISAVNGGPRAWQPDFVAFSARLLPAVDRLCDAVTTGYWAHVVASQEDERHRLATVAEHSTIGIYEADMDGIIRYANPAFLNLIGISGVDIVGRPLSDVIRPLEGSIAGLLSEPVTDRSTHRLSVVGAGSAAVELEIDTFVRRIENDIAGFAGMVRHAAVAAV